MVLFFSVTIRTVRSLTAPLRPLFLLLFIPLHFPFPCLSLADALLCGTADSNTYGYVMNRKAQLTEQQKDYHTESEVV